MHYAKPNARSPSLDDNTPEPCDKAARVKAADLGFYVPDHILPDIIPLSDPKLLFANSHAQRDRRLRQLIRRYSNQIQYGCRTINCSTQTCLSYRKRNSTAPLRKHTDLSARTLAFQLVEDYTRAGKDPIVGLCHNEPVVPWYEDPTLTKKRRNSLERSHQHRHKPHESAIAARNATSPPPPPSGKEFIRHAPLAEHPVRKGSHDGVVLAGRRLRSLDTRTSQPAVQASEEIIEILNSSLDRGNRSSPGSGSPSTPAAAERKDMASFTQALFDLVPLRLLSWLPTAKPPVTDTSPPQTVQATETEQGEETQDLVSNPAHHGEAEPADEKAPSLETSEKFQCQHEKAPGRSQYTLRTLTWASVFWLRSQDRSLDPDIYENNFLPFLKQSLDYCLSDPERLIATANDFQQTYNPPGRNQPGSRTGANAEATWDELGRSSSKSQRTVPLSRPWPGVLTQTQWDLEGILMSMAFLDNFRQRNLVLNSIFVALQHTYVLPRWLQNRRLVSQSKTSSAATERLLRSGGRTKRDKHSPALNADPIGTPADEKSATAVPLKDAEVTELCLLALLAVAAIVFEGGNVEFWAYEMTFSRFRTLRNSGLAHSHWPPLGRPDDPDDNKRALKFVNIMIKAVDMCEDWSVLRLLTGVMDALSHRLAVAKWSSTLKTPNGWTESKKTVIDLLIKRFDRNTMRLHDENEINTSWIGTATVELVRTIMLKKWDRNPVVQRTGPVGGALELLAGMYRERNDLHLDTDVFTMPFIAETFDDISMPSEWLSFRADPRQMHLLSFSFLFEPATLVRYFRAINIEIMRKSHENATLVFNDTRHFMWIPAIPVYGAKEVLAKLRPHMAKYFVLTIRRDDVLDDAINQIWRRERQELMRPLRVRLGKDEGEDGLDHGGVQQEFFRVVFAEALRQDYGMFAVDATTRMAWFQPGSFEPLYRFEALGVLMSLAVYNGLTLPVTFPVALYRKLLDLKVKKLEHIADGWPELTRGLQTLLDWTEGDVGDVIARTYEFSYEMCGKTISINMQKVGRDDPWPPRKPTSNRKGKERAKSTSFELPVETPDPTPPSQPSPDLQASVATGFFPALSRSSSLSVKGISTPVSMSDSDLAPNGASEEAPLVTNANRTQYIKDYVLWLTHKSIADQYEAFARGFYTCLDRTALSIFTPEALKSVMEGHVEIDIDELECATTYDDYTRECQTIVDFWSVVRNMSPAQHRQLLEFVTASDRVPVNGMGSVTFIVQKNGDEDTRLPSSSTCYGRLLLPQYSSRDVLEEKLTKAIENCVGFGTL